MTTPTPTGPAQEPSDTGGPAFPCPVGHVAEGRYHPEGMTLLDYFAGQALSSMMLADEDRTYSLPRTQTYFAESAYGVAVAMLAEKRRRERPPATAQGEKL